MISRMMRRVAVLLIAAMAAGASTAHGDAQFVFMDATNTGFSASPQLVNAGTPCYPQARGVFAPGVTQPTALGAFLSSNGAACQGQGIPQSYETWLSYGQTVTGTSTGGAGVTVVVWEGGTGAVDYVASDPFGGSATLSCATLGAQSETELGLRPIESFMTVETDGTRCVTQWIPGAGPSRLARAAQAGPVGVHTRFVDSLATIRGRHALVRIQGFGEMGARARERVVLRTMSGKVVGKGTGTVVVGDPATTVRVGLDPLTRRTLKAGHELNVRGIVSRADDTPGTGDTIHQLVVRTER